MKLHYCPEADSLYIELSSAAGAEARVLGDHVNVDFDADNGIFGIDIDQASARIDLAFFETSELYLGALRVETERCRVRSYSKTIGKFSDSN